MRKVIGKQFAIILILVLNLTVMILGCDLNSVNNVRTNPSDVEILNYIEQNIDNFNNANENKKQCEVVSEEDSNLKLKYLKFNLNDNTAIQFNINTGEICIEKESIYKNEKSSISIELGGIDAEEVLIYVHYKHGITWCKYKVNDFETPIPDDGNYTKANSIIKENIKAEELQQLYIETKSIYKNMKEIYLQQSL